MKITIFEGTTEELKEAAPYLFPNGLPINTAELSLNPESDTKVEHKEAYRAMLTRRRIKQGQLDLYRVLSQGEVEYNEYLKRMKRTIDQIRGLHGALGRRINNTPEIHEAGLPGNTSAIMINRVDKEKSYFSIKPDFIEVLKEEEII